MKSTKLLTVVIVSCLAMAGALVLVTNSADASDDVNICVTLPWQKEMLDLIGGGKVRVTQFVGPGADPHGGDQGTVSDLVSASRSIAYFYIGANMEWETTNIPLLRSSFPDMPFINMSTGLTFLAAEDECDEHGHDDHEHETIDGHVWTSPANLLIMAGNVRDALIELDGENSVIYEAGFLSYVDRVNDIRDLADDVLGANEGNKFLVWHAAWRYLCNDYGLIEVSMESDYSGELTAGDLVQIRQTIADEGMETIFVRPDDPVWKDGAKSFLESGGISVLQANPLAIDYLDELERFITALENSWIEGTG
ncbi:MAG: zinc ABC transporter substrate-binding protein [Candidatus Methanomethylophilaceae archaeon]|nr:zinc ABC transporter substrate-binding protein [Candidatus Methanomethylophilaceae archaeon]